MPTLYQLIPVRRDLAADMTAADDNSRAILAITGIWCFLAVTVVAMRVYARTVMVRYLGWDDIFIIVSMVIGVAIWACFVGESHYGLGKHWQAITPASLSIYSKYQFAHGMLMVWGLHVMKIAFALFLYRLSERNLYRRTLFAVMGFMTLYTTISWFTILLGCSPVSASWNGRMGDCLSMPVFRNLGMTCSILGVFTDAFLALIPIPIISRLPLNMRTKVCLIVAFGMGLATVACGAVKSYHLWLCFSNSDRLYENSYFVWGALELYVGIIAASLVSLKPLITSFLDKAKSTLSSVAIAKSLHHGPRMHPRYPQSPKVNEKDTQQFNTYNTQNFPHIQICSVNAYDVPATPLINEHPKVFRVETETRPAFTGFTLEPHGGSLQVPKRKNRPAPLSRSALLNSNRLEVSSGILCSPSPTYLGTQDLDFFNLIKAQDPEKIQQRQQQRKQQLDHQMSPRSKLSVSTTFTNSPTTTTNLSLPALCGILTSPSPTYLHTDPDIDLDFFNLIRCRDPEVIAAAANNSSSRNATIMSVPENKDTAISEYNRRINPSHQTYQSIDFPFDPSNTKTTTTTTAQPSQRANANQVRRRPSMAPSTNSTSSAFLCPSPMPADNFRDSPMFFHVMSSGQFRSSAENAVRRMEIDEFPLSPMSVEPVGSVQRYFPGSMREEQWKQQRQQQQQQQQFGYIGYSPVFEDFTGRDRVDSSHAALKKDE